MASLVVRIVDNDRDSVGGNVLKLHCIASEGYAVWPHYALAVEGVALFVIFCNGIFGNTALVKIKNAVIVFFDTIVGSYVAIFFQQTFGLVNSHGKVASLAVCFVNVENVHIALVISALTITSAPCLQNAV